MPAYPHGTDGAGMQRLKYAAASACRRCTSSTRYGTRPAAHACRDTPAAALGLRARRRPRLSGCMLYSSRDNAMGCMRAGRCPAARICLRHTHAFGPAGGAEVQYQVSNGSRVGAQPLLSLLPRGSSLRRRAAACVAWRAVLRCTARKPVLRCTVAAALLQGGNRRAMAMRCVRRFAGSHREPARHDCVPMHIHGEEGLPARPCGAHRASHRTPAHTCSGKRTRRTRRREKKKGAGRCGGFWTGLAAKSQRFVSAWTRPRISRCV